MIWPIAALAMSLHFGQSSPEDRDLATAVKLWRDLDMPELSATSRPVLIPLPYWSGTTGKQYIGIGFTDPKGAGPGNYLQGSETYPGYITNADPKATGILVVDWTPDVVKQVDGGDYSNQNFREHTILCSGIMCEIAGRHEFAKTLLAADRAWIVSNVEDTRGLVGDVAKEIKLHYMNELLRPGSDRKAILEHLTKLQSTGLNQEPWTLVGSMKLPELIKAVRATVRPWHTKPNTPEAAVADLSEATEIEIQMSSHAADPRYLKVRNLGLDAVPALMDHLSDRGLTRSYYEGINMAGEWIVSMNWACEQLLQEISQGEIIFPTRPLTKPYAEKWYRAMRAGKLNDYFLDGAVVVRKYRGGVSKLASLSVFTAILDRHPELIEEAYRRTLRPGVDNDTANRCISQSNLSVARRLELLCIGAHSPVFNQRGNALRYIFIFDRSLFDTLLAESLISLPANQSGNDLAWVCPGSNDDRVWSALVEAIRRSDPKLRRDLILPLASQPDELSGVRFERRVLATLEMFFDDEAVGHDAIKAASWRLGRNHQPEPKTAAQWQSLKEWLRTTIRTNPNNLDPRTNTNNAKPEALSTRH